MSKNMKHKIIKSHLINGVVVILIGIVIFFKGPIDFRGYPINNSVGLIIIVFGALLFITGFKRRSTKDNPYNRT